ncbi:MAG: BBP7 family outer membrane beta-barrel protein [Pirellulales bacterium]
MTKSRRLLKALLAAVVLACGAAVRADDEADKIEPLPKIGALPVASERVARSGARPLPINGKWQHVVTTFDPQECIGPPPGYDHSPEGTPDASLWDQYHTLNFRWWATLEYLNWQVRGYEVPALVTSSPAGTPLADAGVLPGATILFGDDIIEDGERSGGRARLGWWSVDGQFVGYQAEYFGLERARTEFFAASAFDGDNLARPFFNTATGEEDSSLLSGDDVLLGADTFDIDGEISVASESDIHSVALTRRHVLWADFERNFRFDWLIGYRYFRLDESLGIVDLVTLNNPSGGPLPPGTQVRRTDQFGAVNDFHGGEVGLTGEVLRGRWSVEGMGKLAIGGTHQSVDAFGTTEVNPGGVLGFTQGPGLGGFLVQPGLNAGHRSRDAFTFIPEAELAIGYQVTNQFRLKAGASVVYVTRVVRPGDQIDAAADPFQPQLNPTFFPSAGGVPTGTPAPAAEFAESYFWMYGLTIGAEYQW